MRLISPLMLLKINTVKPLFLGIFEIPVFISFFQEFAEDEFLDHDCIINAQIKNQHLLAILKVVTDCFKA